MKMLILAVLCLVAIVMTLFYALLQSWLAVPMFLAAAAIFGIGHLESQRLDKAAK